ncbi:helix-turn-helix transcriptional regulator [Shewanella algidipiscicola]|uniref:helix-turn-helix transcriptional regulator n=1 Tax=Shewanella algidipiscicola TaxID=614070 RepID=UPI000E770BF0|nr:AraC family transcriptional regulator [Shewanella algidipiscicola]
MSSSVESIEYWHPSTVKEVELSRAHFKSFAFEKHVHLDYHIGVVSYGAQQYLHKGQHYQLLPNSLSTLNPDESHNGHSIAPNGYCAHVMSLPVDFINNIAAELNQKSLFFNTPNAEDRLLSQQFLHLHRLLTDKQHCASSLYTETLLTAFITELLCRYTSIAGETTSKQKLSLTQIDIIKQQLHEQLNSNVELATLANSIGLSKFQFLRQFKSATGMTPHAYLTRLRLEYAKKALIGGNTAIDTAYRVGFFDQSHFNKAFKRAFLTTPAQFQRKLIED